MQPGLTACLTLPAYFALRINPKIKPPTSFPCEVKIDGKVVKTLTAATREACYKLIGFGSENCKTYAQYLKPPPSKSFLEQVFNGSDRLSSEYCNWTCTLSSSQK